MLNLQGEFLRKLHNKTCYGELTWDACGERDFNILESLSFNLPAKELSVYLIAVVKMLNFVESWGNHHKSVIATGNVFLENE